jgi:hypothetical protein
MQFMNVFDNVSLLVIIPTELVPSGRGVQRQSSLSPAQASWHPGVLRLFRRARARGEILPKGARRRSTGKKAKSKLRSREPGRERGAEEKINNFRATGPKLR